MTLTIEVSRELEAKIEEEAKRRGLGKEEFICIVLEEKLDATLQKRKPPFEAKIIASDLPVRDRSRENDWLEKHRDDYDGQWVALDGDRLLAHGDKLKEVAKTAKEMGFEDALLVRVEGSNTPRYVGGVW